MMHHNIFRGIHTQRLRLTLILLYYHYLYLVLYIVANVPQI